MSDSIKSHSSGAPSLEHCTDRSRLGAGDVLLMGRPLFGADLGEPVILVAAWCVFCHKSHIFRWPCLNPTPDMVGYFSSHCQRGPLRNGYVYVILDPDRSTENQRVFSDLDMAHLCWRSARGKTLGEECKPTKG
jgi:hypothetical protein